MTDYSQTMIAADVLTVDDLQALEIAQTPMVIAENATIYDTLPVLYEFVQAHRGHYCPSEDFGEAAGRVECEALDQLIKALDLLIAITPAIEKGRG